MSSIRIDKTDCTHSSNKTFGILVHSFIVRELQLVLQYSIIHIGVIVCPEWSLEDAFSKSSEAQVHVMLLTMPVNISNSMVPKLHQSTS